jgi:hypothetical protein
MPDSDAADRGGIDGDAIDCALDLQSGRCTLEATAHCRQACPYQAMLRDGTVPQSPAEMVR